MKILIVDDEPLARERLLRLLAKLRPDAELFEAADGQQAITRVEKQDPDLILLDIRMPGMDGLEVAGLLDQMPLPPAVVFCTAYDEYALQALEHQAVAYLLKPVRERELEKALSTAARVNRLQLEQLQGEDAAPTSRQTISSHSSRGFESLRVDEIRCFIAQDKHVAAITPEAEISIADSLRELEQEFGDQFLRVHRNALVAPAHIERLVKCDDGSWQVVLRDISQQPVISRRHLSEVRDRLRSG